MRVGALLFISVCAAACGSDAPVDLVEVYNCPSCAVGQVRRVYRAADGRGEFFLADHRVHYGIDKAVTELDENGDYKQRQQLDLPDGTEIMTAAGDDAGHLYLGYRVTKLDDNGVGSIDFFLRATEHDLDYRWQLRYGSGWSDPQTISGGNPGPIEAIVKADSEGAYLAGVSPDAKAYAAADGHVRYEFPNSGYPTFEADGNGGLYYNPNPYGVTPSITALDAMGVPRWTTTVNGSALRFATNTDGTIAIVGTGPGLTTLVALLDSTGATLFTHAVDPSEGGSYSIANLGNGVIAVATTFRAFLFDKTGKLATYSFVQDNLKELAWRSLLPAADGSLWASVWGDGVHVDGQTVGGGGQTAYLINFVP